MITKYMRGGVFWCDLPRNEKSPNVIWGRRPVVIVSNDVGNINSEVVTVIPCTTNTSREYMPTHCTTKLIEDTLSTVECEQITTLNKYLLSSFIGLLDTKTMKEIDNCMMYALALSLPKQEDKPENIKIEPAKTLGVEKVEVMVEKSAPKNKKKTDEEMKEFMARYEKIGSKRIAEEMGLTAPQNAINRYNYYKKRLAGRI